VNETDSVSPSGETVEGLLSVAALAVRFGRPEDAIAGYRRVLAIQPQNAQALLGLAALILERGFVDDADLDGAIDVCRAAIPLLPNPAPAHVLLGQLLLGAGRAREAIEAYLAALALVPANPAAFVGVARALLAAGDAAAALQAADTALQLNAGFPEAWLVRGNALLVLHQPATAVAAFAQGAALAPDDARMHLGLGDAYAEIDHDRQAIEHLARAVSLDPASKWAHANLGSMLYRAGELEGAERHCRSALAIDPEMAIVHQNLAGILADRGEADEARRHRDRAYGLSNLRISRAAQARATVLVLTTSDSGNIPHRFLLPKDAYTRLDWFIEYARPGQEDELPPYEVVFNIIGDPDYSGGTAGRVAEFLKRCDRRVLNDPARVGPTRRDRLPALIGDIDGVRIPRCARLDPSMAATTNLSAWLAAEGLDMPVLIRPLGSHGGEGLFLALSDQELASIDVSSGAYATEFVDFASAADGRYRKYRVIFVDRTPYPYHLAVKDDWLVHYYTAGMSGDEARKAEELRFLEDPCAVLGKGAWAALGAIGARLDLDFAGIDFGLLPDGRILVFEANATMLVHPEPDGEFAYKNPHVARITGAFQDLIARPSHERNALRH
jgi:tetratricopeptide (TPR) repeat protein